MIQHLQGKLHQAMTLVNPIIGLPTPHQRSVNRIIARLSDIEKARDYYFGFEPVTCTDCSGTGVLVDWNLECPRCSGYGYNYEHLGVSK